MQFTSIVFFCRLTKYNCAWYHENHTIRAVFGQPPRQGVFPGLKGPSIMEDVEDIIKEDEEVNVLQDQSLGKGQEDGVVDIEQWHTLENTTSDNVRSGDNDKLE